jgi:hypothetical protein
MPFYFDTYYMILVVPALILAVVALASPFRLRLLARSGRRR